MIVVERLRKVFPNGHVALADVSLTIDPGEIVCVVGRSGAGKSTLLRCLNGTLNATSGRIAVDDVEVTSASEIERRRLRRRIGFVYQELNLVDRVSVLRNVLVGRLGHANPLATCLGLFTRADRELALFNLDRVHLLDRAGQRADTLSGGEKQRVAIARAMTQEPLVLLADEPVASLDRELSRGVMDDLRRVAREEGVPTVINIHDVALARAYADRIVGIAGGLLVFDGRPAALDDAALDRIYRAPGLPGTPASSVTPDSEGTVGDDLAPVASSAA